MKVKAIASLAITSVILAACSAGPDSSGLEYMPDMYRSAAIEPYVDYGQIKERINPTLANKLSAKVPPFGTIPYYGTDSTVVAMMMPFQYLPNSAFKLTHDLRGFDFSNDDTYNLAAADNTNRYPLTAENAESVFSEGKKLFVSKCSQCHGEKGDGQGTMVKNGIYAGVPDYADKKELSNAQMFYSIYYGKGAMGSHASILNKKEIWTLIHYIRKIQNPEYGNDLQSSSKSYGSADEVKAVDLKTIDITASKGQSLRLGDILFDSGKATINLQKSPGLESLLTFLKSNNEKVIISGYTDTKGDDASNLVLSQERATAVKTYLEGKGIDASRIEAIGKGESNPVLIGGVENETLSRRTELTIK